MEALPFGIKVKRESDAQIIYLSGELDYLATLELIPKLADLAKHCSGELLFDLEQVTMIDSEGIKMLLMVFAAMDHKFARARIIKCSEHAWRIIKMAKADAIFGMNKDSNDSLAPYQSPHISEFQFSKILN